jgi:hypothetical protein
VESALTLAFGVGFAVLSYGYWRWGVEHNRQLSEMAARTFGPKKLRGSLESARTKPLTGVEWFQRIFGTGFFAISAACCFFATIATVLGR